MNIKLCAVSILSMSAIAASIGSAMADNAPLAKTADQVLSQTQPVHVQAQITGLDPANRVVMLRGPRGDVTIQVGKEVTNFDQLHIGDRVDVDYKNALLVGVKKIKAGEKVERARVDTTAYQPTSGAKGVTGFDALRQVEVVATVQSIDNKKHTITLRGPQRTETFDLAADFAAEHLKKGDMVHAVFVSATAVQVTPAANSTN